MKRARGQDWRSTDASFDLTSMIDVVLLLIFFFMLTATFANIRLAPLDLPREAGEETSRPDLGSVVIDLDADGRILMLGSELSRDEAIAVVQDAAREAAGSPLGLDLIVRADRNCPASHLNGLASALAGIGVRTWKLATTTEGGV